MTTALETRPLAQRSWTSGIDARALALELSREVRGEVRFSPGSRALYANDASVYRQVPIGVVVPRREEDVLAALEICRRHGAPIGARGCGTGLAGQTVNEVVLFDFSKYMNRLLELDPKRRLARVQPGIVLDELRDAAEEHDLTFGPDPATHSRCTLGGMIGNNSCGTHSIMAGVTADNVEALDVVLYDGTRLLLPCRVDEDELEERIARGGREGEIYARLRDLRDRYGDLVRERYPDIPRRVSGYNLERLLPEHGFNLAAALVGTEATCMLLLQAHLKLIHSPQHRSLVLIGYGDAPTAADHVPEIMEFGPIGLETFDRRLVDNELRKGFKRHPELLPDGEAWLLVEFGGDSEEEANGQAEEMIAALEKAGGEHTGSKLYEDAEQIKQVWEIREGGEGNSKVPGVHPGWPSWEDAAVPPARTGEYLRDLEALCEKHGRRVSTFFGHAGHGCIHTRIDWDFLTPEGVANYRAFMEDAAELVCDKYNGSLSGEHGDGQARGELLDRMFGPELVEAFAEFKAIFDPEGRMNPGKVVNPYPLDTNLRLGPDYRPAQLETHFNFPEDGGRFGEAVERCLGVGACRDQSGTMCPSYQVTLEERHSTRGRARLLFEMMRGEELEGGWRNEDVKEALDLCLACKGCKHECPVRVDMATYKAEFLSHYWQGRLRPRQAYALGLIPWEARLAARAPRLANFVLQREPLGRLARRAVGVAPERKPPEFAERTFKSWFAERGRRHASGRRVLLWGDTFNDHFHPEVAIAAVEGLEALGFEVAVPTGKLCCGRPLYDYGMLKLARRQLRRILGALAAEIEAGTPLITLEPSCGAVFRDELVNLFPDDPQARRLARMTTSLGEFLAEESERVELPRLEGKALVHLHCHQKATTDTDCDVAVLERLGVEPEVLDSGCCGLAGSFGYEAGEHYDVSIKAAERVLIPALRDAEPGTLVVSDGFSCRSQIEHCGEAPPLHLAQVLQRALRTESKITREAGGTHDE
ncbi:MAG: FAD-binding and (Fe-S)-binding domain-containing protein [Solirubrobacterales bacterium]